MDDNILHRATDKAKYKQRAGGRESLIQPVNLDA